MPTILLIALAIVAVVIVVLLVVVALQPAEFRIERSAKIAAPPADVFAQVNDFHHWEAWSPYAKIDPAMQKSYSGASSGVGAVYSWNGNSEVGEGSTTIVESRPNDLIRIKLAFLRPFTATNEAAFTFQPDGQQTTVTWSLTGHKNFMMKAVHLVMNMDKMVGGQFDEGLASLKKVVEGGPGK